MADVLPGRHLADGTSSLGVSARRALASLPPRAAPGSFELLTAQQATIAPNWRNEVTLNSFERVEEYRPALSIDLISPRPLLMKQLGWS